MFFLPTFQRSFDLVHALRQFSLTVFLLPSILCFFASSYIIDDSCQHYKGNDITGDIEQAINEVRDMAHSAFVATLTEAPRVNNLLVTLFGPDRSRHDIVVEYFWRISRTLGPTTDFVLNCDDQRIKLEEDKFQEPPDPLGVWIDHRYKWLTGFNNLDPCEPATRNLPPGQDFIYAYTMSERVIYLCSHVLDIHIGRSLASYKDADNTGLYIDDLLSLPVILFHELLHTRSFQLIDAELRSYPPLNAFFDRNINVYDPLYVSSLPMTRAYGFTLCQKLAIENPDVANRNCDSVALCALGLYLHKNDWGKPHAGGTALDID